MGSAQQMRMASSVGAAVSNDEGGGGGGGSFSHGHRAITEPRSPDSIVDCVDCVDKILLPKMATFGVLAGPRVNASRLTR